MALLASTGLWRGLETLLGCPVDAAAGTRALNFAALLLALDLFVTHSPLGALLPRALGIRPSGGAAGARRLASQVAARVAGCVFLAAMAPRALAALRDPALAAAPLVATSPDSAAAAALAAGYFMYDTAVVVAKYSENGPEFLLHGALCACCYAYAALTGRIHYFGAGFLAWEASTPLLYARWAALKAGLAGTRRMHVLNAAFIAVFTACRVVYGPLLSLRFYAATQADLLARAPLFSRAALLGLYAAMAALNALNFMWFGTMVKLAVSGGGGSRARPKAA